MDNYKVELADGTETYYQFEEEDPGLKSLQAAAKAKDSEVKSVTKGDPPKTSSPELQGVKAGT